MSKIILIGVDAAKHVFHLVSVDAHGQYVWRKQLSRGRFLSTLSQVERCEVVLEACGASHHWARSIKELGHKGRQLDLCWKNQGSWKARSRRKAKGAHQGLMAFSSLPPLQEDTKPVISLAMGWPNI